MDTNRFKIENGRIVELGPQVILMELPDFKELAKLDEEVWKADTKWNLLLPTLGLVITMLPIIEFFVELLLYKTEVAAWPKLPGLNFLSWMMSLAQPDGIVAAVIFGFLLLGWIADRLFIRPKRKRIQAKFERKRQAILSKYGDYKLDEVTTTLDSRSWRPKKYVLVPKE
ncbi:MAG: hypothetical protein V4474_02760 [Patescibacteria group bacterium]